MNRRALFLGGLAFLSATPIFASPLSSLSPINMVKTLYAGYIKTGANPDADPLEGFELKDFFTDELYRAFNAGLNRGDDELPDIDWDVFVNAQDYLISNFRVLALTTKATHQLITARFSNFKRRTTVNYAFVKTALGWRVDDIRYPKSKAFAHGFSLRAFLKDVQKNRP